MGIESEQLVYDYLSRVGDLAGQSAGLTAAQRARLVNELRQSIDAQRASSSSSSARAEANSVRRILAGLGTPDEVVRRASGGATWAASGPAVPVPSTPAGAGVSASIPAQASPPTIEGRVEFVRPDAGRSPVAGVPWWSVEPEAGGFPSAGGVRMVQPPGWSGSFDGDFLSPDGSAVVDPITGLPAGTGPAAVPADPGAAGQQSPVPARPGLLRRLLGARVPAPQTPGAAPAPVASVPRPPIPFVEALATLVLVAAAVTGLWYVALLGWLFAYGGRRFGHGVGKVAALWIPGLVALACGFWLYSRAGHPAGHPALSNAQFTAATHNAFALWLRASSGLSAAFLAWRITRR